MLIAGAQSNMNVSRKGDGNGKKWEGRAHTNLLSLPCSLFSLTFSHFLSKKRLRRGDALGVEQLDQEDGASSSLDGVISIEGNWRYSLKLEGDLAVKSLLVCRMLIISFSLHTFLMCLIFKRLRWRVGVEELDRTVQSETVLLSPSEYAVASCGMLTWSEGGLSVSLITSRVFLKSRQEPLKKKSLSRSVSLVLDLQCCFFMLKKVSIGAEQAKTQILWVDSHSSFFNCSQWF